MLLVPLSTWHPPMADNSSVRILVISIGLLDLKRMDSSWNHAERVRQHGTLCCGMAAVPPPLPMFGCHPIGQVEQLNLKT